MKLAGLAVSGLLMDEIICYSSTVEPHDALQLLMEHGAIMITAYSRPGAQTLKGQVSDLLRHKTRTRFISLRELPLWVDGTPWWTHVMLLIDEFYVDDGLQQRATDTLNAWVTEGQQDGFCYPSR